MNVTANWLKIGDCPSFSSDDVVEAIASRCTEVDSGARNIDHILSHILLPEMSRELLSRMAEAVDIQEVKVTVGDAGFVYEVS